ncbi:MAG TPA: serine protease [Planctomycetota bacterium]
MDASPAAPAPRSGSTSVVLGVLLAASLSLSGAALLKPPSADPRSAADRRAIFDSVHRVASMESRLTAALESLERTADDAHAVESGLRERIAEQELTLAGQRAESERIVAGLNASATRFAGFEKDLALVRRDLRDTELDLVARTTEPDPHLYREHLRERILDPVLQITGQDAVGSAVLIHRGGDSRGSYYLALTSYHVVRDILAERGTPTDPGSEPIKTISDGGAARMEFNSLMVAHDAELDLALLEMRPLVELPAVAQLAPLGRTVEVFDPVYTVGCPLGTATQATHGQITREDWQLDGKDFWMLSSPAYFGNSGGGVFLEDTLELVGIFAKIYTHGSYRPQVVTHMGLAIQLETLHGWLREIGYERVLPPPLPAENSTDGSWPR